LIDFYGESKMLFKRFFILCYLVVPCELFAMSCFAPSVRDLEGISRIHSVVFGDSSAACPVSAADWMEKAVKHQACTFIEGSMGLPSSQDGMDAYVCEQKAVELDAQYVKEFNGLSAIENVITTLFAGNKEFEEYVEKAIRNLNEI
jgi:hypothetical protein